MRIGIYDPYLDDLGGGEKYMMSIAQVLSQNHDVRIFWDKKSDIENILQRFNLDLSKARLAKNIFSPSISLFERLSATSGYDSIIFLSDGSIPLTMSRKLFLHVQQPLERSQTQSLWGKLKMKRVTKVFCNSYYTKGFVDPTLNVFSQVIYPAVPIHAKKIKKENIILHVGRFRVANVGVSDYKKQGIMVDAFINMIKKGLKGWKFVIAVGLKPKDSEEFAILQKKAEGYPIHFEKNLSNDELWGLYGRAKIYWHASGFGEDLSSHPEFAEHFGISTVEAMGAGVVPVVINKGGQTEIVTDSKNGLLWETIEELQEKTAYLIQNNNVLEKLSLNAKKRAQDFSYDMFVKSIEELVR